MADRNRSTGAKDDSNVGEPVKVVREKGRDYIRIDESLMHEDELYQIMYQNDFYFMRKRQGVTEIFREMIER